MMSQSSTRRAMVSASAASSRRRTSRSELSDENRLSGRLAAVIAIDADITVRQVAGPDRGTAAADADIDLEYDLAATHVLGDRRFVIVRDDRAVPGNDDAADPDGKPVA